MLARALPLPGAQPDASPLPPPDSLGSFGSLGCLDAIEVRSGLADLDRSGVLAPGTLTLADVDGRASDVLYAWMADAAVQGRMVLVADGGNFLDAYRLAAAARRRAAERFPDAPRRELAAFEEIALERVRLARGFTAYQVQAIVEDILPTEGEREGEGHVGLIVATGLLDMYLDDELSRDESQTLAKRALSTLRRLAARHHAPAIVSNSVLSPFSALNVPAGASGSAPKQASAHPMRILLDESVDEHVILHGTPYDGLAIRLPRRGAAFFTPGRGRTRLEDFLGEDERATAIAPIPARKPGAWVSNGNRMYGKFGEARRREPGAVMEAREARRAW